MLPQRRVEDRKAQEPQPEATRDDGSEHFNSFQFWREPVAALDSELLGLLVGSPSLLLNLDPQRSQPLIGSVCLGVVVSGSGSSRGSSLWERAAGRTDGRTDIQHGQQ